MRIGVVGFVPLTWLMAIVERDPLWIVLGLCAGVPFAMICRLPPDVRQRLSRHFPP